jgi:predicted dehydrogenase
LLGEVAVSARGQAFTPGAEHEDVAFLTIEYANGTLCHCHASWLNPRKVRQLTVVGDAQMAVWDDMQPLEPLRFYDKGLSQKRYTTFGEFQMVLRDGDIAIPKVEMFEPLVRQDAHFLACIRGDAELRQSDGRSGLGVVRVLEAAVSSLNQDGRRIVLE